MIVTAGPTFEAIDTVRGITNMSSGKMGYAVAEAAAAMGADVTLISGPTALAPPAQAHFVYATTAAEMLRSSARMRSRAVGAGVRASFAKSIPR